MAIIKELKSANYVVAVWRVTEDIEQLREILNEPCIVDGIEKRCKNVQRQCEQIVAHLIIKHLTGSAKEIKHNDKGAPFIENFGKFISISHNRHCVAVAISNAPIGIDIEEQNRKQYALYKRYTSLNEQRWIEGTKELSQKQLIAELIWSAKEAIYKLSDCKGLSFEQDIEIEPFEICSGTTFNALYRGKKGVCAVYIENGELLVICI